MVTFFRKCIPLPRLYQSACVYSEVNTRIMPFYAVAKGIQPGVFETWSECQKQITGFKGPVFKKFSTEKEALEFVQERSSNLIDKRKENAESKKRKPSPPSESKEKSSSKDSSSKRSKEDKAEEDDQEPSKAKKIKLNEDEKDASKFCVDSDGFLVVYTDGACGFNGRQGAKAGVGVYFGDDHPMNVSEPVKGRATNNTAEIQAATYAFELTKSAGFDKVLINTDSQFMISCATSWMPNWKKNDWKKKDGSEVINKEDLIELDKASNGLLVKWNHVDAHKGIPGNEAADRLAREGSKRYKKED